MQTSSPAVVISNVTVTIGEIVALDNISLTIEHGEFTAIVGPNGAGKTTLIRSIIGLQKIDSGTIQILGSSVTRPGSLKCRIGYVPQILSVDLTYPVSVYETVIMGTYGLVGPGRPIGAAQKMMAEEAIEKANVQDLRDRPIGRLSGGQRQRVLIARALACRPDLLILDEPTTGVDATTSESLYTLLKQLNENGTTIMVVTHDIGVTASYAHKVVCLNRTLVSHGRPEEALCNESLAKMYGCDVAYFQHGRTPHIVVEEHNV